MHYSTYQRAIMTNILFYITVLGLNVHFISSIICVICIFYTTIVSRTCQVVTRISVIFIYFSLQTFENKFEIYDHHLFKIFSRHDEIQNFVSQWLLCQNYLRQCLFSGWTESSSMDRYSSECFHYRFDPVGYHFGIHTSWRNN